MLLAFRLPTNWFPNEWTQVSPREKVGASAEPLSFDELTAAGATRPKAEPTSKFEKRTWNVIEVLERHPTPEPALVRTNSGPE